MPPRHSPEDSVAMRFDAARPGGGAPSFRLRGKGRCSLATWAVAAPPFTHGAPWSAPRAGGSPHGWTWQCPRGTARDDSVAIGSVAARSGGDAPIFRPRGKGRCSLATWAVAAPPSTVPRGARLGLADRHTAGLGSAPAAQPGRTAWRSEVSQLAQEEARHFLRSVFIQCPAYENSWNTRPYSMDSPRRAH